MSIFKVIRLWIYLIRLLINFIRLKQFLFKVLSRSNLTVIYNKLFYPMLNKQLSFLTGIEL